VNRLCVATDKPLVESGTAGYLGQVQVIKKVRTGSWEKLVNKCRESGSATNANPSPLLNSMLTVQFDLVLKSPFIVLFGPRKSSSKRRVAL
jgi:hypothetical protein